MTSFPVYVLVADNDKSWPDVAMQEIRRAGYTDDQVIVTPAYSVDEAEDAIAASYFDIAFIDLRLSKNDSSITGHKLMETLAHTSPSCKRVFSTSYLNESFAEVSNFETGHLGGSTFVLNKLNETVDGYSLFVSRFFTERLRAQWTLTGLELVAEAIARKGRRIPHLRATHDEVTKEIRALMYELFHQSASMPLSATPTTIHLSLMAGGLSASVVAKATPDFGPDAKGEPIRGNRCVVKVGRRSSIVSEALRYEQVVRLGMPSEYRIEMFGSAEGDALGAICYSFAGGSQSDDIVAFDHLLTEDSTERAAGIVGDIFNQDHRRWYSIPGANMQPLRFLRDSFGSLMSARLDDVYRFLATSPVGEVERDGRRHKFVGDGFSLPLPSTNDLGVGVLKSEYPTCLVHGDLHGGNLLLTSEGQLSMIDFANTGFGPRFIDGAALGSAIRLTPLTEVEVTPEHLASAARTYRDERSLLRSGKRDFEGQAWQWKLLSLLDDLMIRNFIDTTPREDLERERNVTSFAYALSRLANNLPWTELQRMRLVSWMCASYGRLFER